MEWEGISCQRCSGLWFIWFGNWKKRQETFALCVLLITVGHGAFVVFLFYLWSLYSYTESWTNVSAPQLPSIKLNVEKCKKLHSFQIKIIMQLSVTQTIILTSTQQVFNCLSYVRCLCDFAGKEEKICYLCELIVTACQLLVYFSTSIVIVTMMGNIHGHQSGSGLGKVHLQQNTLGEEL